MGIAASDTGRLRQGGRMMKMKTLRRLSFLPLLLLSLLPGFTAQIINNIHPLLHKAARNPCNMVRFRIKPLVSILWGNTSYNIWE